MGKLKNHQKGFSAVDAVLILVIVGLVGLVGWLVYKNQHRTATSSIATSSTTKAPTSSASTLPNFPSTYNGWNDYCISSVNLCFKYPQGYNLEDCKDGPSPSDCGIETKGVRNTSDSFPVVSWDIALAGSAQTSGPCAQHGTYSTGPKLPYIANLYVAKYTVSGDDPYFNGEVTHYLLDSKNQAPTSANCQSSFISKDGKYTIQVSARDGSPATPNLSNAQIASYDDTITDILNSFYYK